MTALHWLPGASSGGGRLVVGHDIGGATEIVDVATGAVTEVEAQADAVRSLAANRAGTRLYVGGEDGRINEVSLIDGYPRVVGGFSARLRLQENDDGATVFGLMSGPDDGVLLSIQGSKLTAWERDPERLVALACARADRALTDLEAPTLGLDAATTVC